MNKRERLVGWLMVVAVVLSAGCGGTGGAAGADPTASAEQVPVVSRTSDTVIAEGVIEPARWSELHLKAGGEVVEVLVSVGDQVVGGAALVRLDTDELEITLQSAREDVVAQKAALAQLVKGTRETVIARADKDNADQIAQAEVALRAVKVQLEKARAEDPAANVDAARARITQLELQLAQAKTQDPAPQARIAQVGVERVKIALDDAQNEYIKSLDRPWEDQGIRDAWARQVEQKKLDYRLAQAQLDSAWNAQRAHAASLDMLEAQIVDAEIPLAQALDAQGAYAVALKALEVEVEAAQIRLEALQTWENPYRDKASEEEIAQLEARIRQAELVIDRLELQVQDATLYAPFDGTVVDVHVEVGDEANPGQMVMVLATLDQIEVRTTDLTELDVAQVVVGQSVAVSVDALPEREFDGVVSEISLRGGDYRGDVVYAVTIEFADTGDAPLRWGMTALVKIDVK